MTQRIGKYRVYEDDASFKIRYHYTFSDIIGSIGFLVSFLLGLLLLYVSVRTFNSDKINSWVILLVSIVLILFGAYTLISGFYNPTGGILQIDKTRQVLIIRDFLKVETIQNELIASITYELKSGVRPRILYSILLLRLHDGTKKECFIIRSSTPIDLGRAVEKEIHSVSRKLRDLISDVIFQK